MFVGRHHREPAGVALVKSVRSRHDVGTSSHEVKPTASVQSHVVGISPRLADAEACTSRNSFSANCTITQKNQRNVALLKREVDVDPCWHRRPKSERIRRMRRSKVRDLTLAVYVHYQKLQSNGQNK